MHLLLLAAACAVPRPAADGPAPASRCTEGVSRLAYWQGEYPGPVVHVTAPVTVPARAEPCDPAPTAECTLAEGLLHPWGAGDGFLTLRTAQRYRATAPFAPLSVAAGEEVLVTGYQGEGMCTLQVRGEEHVFECPGDGFEQLPAQGPALEVQLLKPPGCDAWIQVDDALFAHESIRQGDIPRHGEVAPATAPAR